MSRAQTLRDPPESSASNTSNNNIHTLDDPTDPHQARDTPTLCDFRIVTTSMIVINVLIFLIQVISGTSWTNEMSNQPIETFHFHQLYRWITHSFQHLTVIHILFNMFSLHIFGQSLEGTFGSLPMLALTFLFSIFEGILYTYIMALLDVINPKAFFLLHSIAGFSSNLFAYFWLYFVAFNIRELSCFGYFTFPARAYPIILVILTAFGLNVGSWVAHLTGIITGLCYHFGLLNYFTLPRTWLIFFEQQTKVGRVLSNLPGYVRTPSRLNQHIEKEQFSIFKKAYSGGGKFCSFGRSNRSGRSSSTTGTGHVLGSHATNTTTISSNYFPRGTHPLATPATNTTPSYTTSVQPSTKANNNVQNNAQGATTVKDVTDAIDDVFHSNKNKTNSTKGDVDIHKQYITATTATDVTSSSSIHYNTQNPRTKNGYTEQIDVDDHVIDVDGLETPATPLLSPKKAKDSRRKLGYTKHDDIADSASLDAHEQYTAPSTDHLNTQKLRTKKGYTEHIDDYTNTTTPTTTPGTYQRPM